jgi:hypothetical protein
MSTARQTTPSDSSADVSKQVDAQMQKLLLRSATDQEFRKKLLTTPREALREFHGQEIPATVDVRFIENTADATFVLPDPIDPAAELSEQEMEAVAGGITLAPLLSIIATVISIAKGIKNIGDDDAWFS